MQTSKLKENEILMIGVSPDGKISSCVFNDKGEKLKEEFILQLSDDEIKKLGEISTFYFEAEPGYLKTKTGNNVIRLQPIKDVPKNFSILSETDFYISKFVLRKLYEYSMEKGLIRYQCNVCGCSFPNGEGYEIQFNSQKIYPCTFTARDLALENHFIKQNKRLICRECFSKYKESIVNNDMFSITEI